jgi:hypothetical protein
MSHKALIYKPAKTAMQSGRGKTKNWLLEFTTDDRKIIDSIMGWVGSSDTARQLRLQFATQEEAVNYAKAHQLEYEIKNVNTRRILPKSYAANFDHQRRQYHD